MITDMSNCDNVTEASEEIIGVLYCYDTGHDKRNTGLPIIKVGCSEGDGNRRINDEMKETLSAGSEEILQINNDYIPICFIKVPTKKSIRKLEKELFKMIQNEGAERAHRENKELFVSISVNQIVECMKIMIQQYGGRMSKYEKINFLTPEYDEYEIDYGDNYNDDSDSELIKNRVKEFIGKKIRDIRTGETLKKTTFQYGGSPNKMRYCNKADFDYILKDTNKIKLVET